MSFSQIMHIIAVLLTGLMAGFMYAYQYSVIGGLAQLGDKAYLMAFQSINRVILNPWFFASFIGCLLVLPMATWLSYGPGTGIPFYFLLAASLVYFIGVFGVTLFCNVPLNNALENFNIGTASVEELLELRKLFEQPWNKYHLIRTLASIISFLLCIFSIFKIR